MSEARLSPSGQLLGGATIEDGTYDGQPVKWDGAEYVPLALGDALVLRALESDGVFTIQSADTLQLIAAGAGAINLESDAAGFNLTTTGGEFALNVGSGLGVFNVTAIGAVLEAVAVSIRTGDLSQVLQLSSGLSSLVGDAAVLIEGASLTLKEPTEVSLITLDSSAINVLAPGLQLTTALADIITLSPLGVSGIQITSDKLGFYDKVPVARPAITGVTEQQQIDSIVSALVALGLVTDGR